MKRTFINTILPVAIFQLISVGASAADSKMIPGTYQVDTAHSKVGFEVSHLVISTVEGKFTQFEGNIDLNDKFEKSKVKISASISSIDTGVSKRDDHLKSPDFFDAAKFPKMSFESSAVVGSPSSFKLTGDLKIRDKSKKVTFDGKYSGTVVDGYGNQVVVFSASTKVSRKDFGLTWNNAVEAGPIVGDEVTINLKIEANRPIAKK